MRGVAGAGDGRPEAGEVGQQGGGSGGGGEVVAEDPGPEEACDVEVDDLARPVQLQGGGRDGGRRAGRWPVPQLASPWLGGTSSTHVLPRASCTSAPEASV